MKYVLLLMTLLVTFIGFPTMASAAQASFVLGSPEYQVDGQPRSMDVTPIIENGRVLLPVRYVAEACGVDPSSITFDKNAIMIGRTLWLSIGAKILVNNQVPITMDVAPIVRNGRTYLPAKYVAEALGHTVTWDETTRTVKITKSDDKDYVLARIDEFLVSINNEIDETQRYLDKVGALYNQGVANKETMNKAFDQMIEEKKADWLARGFSLSDPEWLRLVDQANRTRESELGKLNTDKLEEAYNQIKARLGYLMTCKQILTDLRRDISNNVYSDFTKAKEALDRLSEFIPS